MGRARDISDFLGKTEAANTTNKKLFLSDTANLAGVDSATVVSLRDAAVLTYYSTVDSLPQSGLSVGDRAFVEQTKRLYVSNGTGWYNVALINLSPTMSLSPEGTIAFTTESLEATVTITATDSDNPDTILSYSVESDGNGIGKYVISQDSSVFSIRALSEDSGATAGEFTLTFKTTDNINISTATKDFSLSFITIVDSSAETILLMKATGNSATNADITYQNSSDVSTGFTETGTPQASTFSPYRSGGYSGYFDGGLDYLQIGSNADMINWMKNGSQAAGTLEAWIYITSLKTASNVYTHPAIFANGSTYFNFGVQNGQLRFYYWTGAQNYIDPAGATLSTHRWYHVALTQDSSNTLRIFLDGALVSTTTSFPGISWGTGSSGNNFFVGTEVAVPATSGWAGYIKDARISTTARYTSAFTPPTEPLTSDGDTEVLVCHLPYFVDGSSSPYSLTITDAKTAPFGPFDYEPWAADDVGGSVHFDGTNDYMEVSNSSDFAFGTGDFTVEAWVNYTTFSGSGGQAIVSNGTSISSGTTGHWYLTAYGATDLRFGRHGSAQYTSVTSNLVVNAWNHIAVTRSGTTVRIFVNGISLTTSDTAGGVGSYDFNNTSGILMIGEGASFSKASGHIADVRIIKGTAQYTSDFTPPTAPLSHTGSGTSLLMNNKSDANIYDASSSYLLELNGNTISSTTQRKFTTSSSMYFDGTGDYITIDDGFHFGTADFTFEFWLYPTEDLTNATQLFINPETSGSGVTWSLSTNTYGGYNGLLFAYGQYGSYTVGKYVNNYWPPQNTWTHLVAQRRNGTVEIYVNGTSQTLATYNENSTFSDGADLTSNYTSRDFFDGLEGYVQDLRITRGKARYAGNFTPPTAEFDL